MTLRAMLIEATNKEDIKFKAKSFKLNKRQNPYERSRHHRCRVPKKWNFIAHLATSITGPGVTSASRAAAASDHV